MLESVPSGIQVKANHFVGLADYESPLMVQVDVSGGLGTATGKRVFIPAVFFEANAKPLFAQSKNAKIPSTCTIPTLSTINSP